VIKTFLRSENLNRSPVFGQITIPLFAAAISSKAKMKSKKKRYVCIEISLKKTMKRNKKE